MRRLAILALALALLAGCENWQASDPHDPHVNYENHEGFGP
jgi:hypothetical protein